MAQKNRMVVLGGGGFIGARLSAHLAGRGCEVLAFDRHFQTPPKRGISRHIGDFSDRLCLDGLLREGDVCFHLICSTVPGTSGDVLFDLKTNMEPTLVFLDLAARRKVKKIIFASSGGTVYGQTESVPIKEIHPENPISSYGITKLSIEKHLFLFHKTYGLSACALRLSNPYGAWVRPAREQGVIPVFMNRALRGEALEIWGDGSVVRDYIHIDDVTRAFELAAELEDGWGLFNIGSGIGHSLLDIIAALKEISGLDLQLNFSPGRRCDVQSNILDIGLAAEKLKWRPQISLQDGLAETWRALKALTALGRIHEPPG